MGAETLMLDTEDEYRAQHLFRENNWTDGLPVIIPTRDRVDDFLRESGYAEERERSLGPMALSNDLVTVESIAINSLMAGASPEHLGVVVAAVQAMITHDYGLRSVQATTNPATPFLLVNGPIAKRVNLNAGNDALGPSQHANGPIGRSVRLVMRNVGGAVEGIDHATLGQPAKFTFCLAEAESASPWEPFHRSVGYEEDRDVVTVFAIENLVNMVPTFGREIDVAESLIFHLGQVMRVIGTNIFRSAGSPAVVISPGHAEHLAKAGYSRQGLQEALFEESKVPPSYRPFGNNEVSTWKLDERDRILICEKAEDIAIVVAGGGEALHSLYLQPWLSSRAVSCPVAKPGEVVDVFVH